MLPSPREYAVWLRAHRLACQPMLSQAKLAELAQCSRNAIARIERGERAPSLELAWRLWLVIRSVETGKLDFAHRKIITAWDRMIGY